MKSSIKDPPKEDKPPNKGQNGVPEHVHCSEVPLYRGLTSTRNAILLQDIAWLALAVEASRRVHAAVAAPRAVQQALVHVHAGAVVGRAQEEPFPTRTLVTPGKVEAVLVTPTIGHRALVDICQ